MKKHLLLAAAALLGFVATATELPSGTQVTNETVTSAFTDGTVVALQCLDTNGGPGYYFNGASAKTQGFSSDNLFTVKMQDDGKFALQNLNTQKYVGCANSSFSGNALVAMVDDVADAAKFTASVATASSWTTIWSGVTNGTNTIRFTAQSNSYLNTNNTALTPKYFNGAGGFSVWYAFTFTEDEVNQIQNFVWKPNLTANTPYIVKNLNKGLYLNGQQVDMPDANNASVSAIPSIIYFEQNPENDTQFAIRVNSPSDKWIGINGTWNSALNSEGDLYYWTLSEATGTATANGSLVYFAKNSNAGENLICNGTINSANGNSVYTNQPAGTNGTAWEIIPLSSVNIRQLATSAYQTLTGTSVGAYSRLNNIPTTNEQLAALATVLSNNASTDAEIIAALNAITFNEYQALSANIQPTDGAIYTIESTDVDARGYLCINNGMLNTTKSSEAPAYDATSNNFRFVAIEKDGNLYFYNPATEQFLNAFGPDTDANNANFADNVDHVWQVSDHGTPITLNTYTNPNQTIKALAIQGGLEPGHHYSGYTNHPQAGGMTLVGNGGSKSFALVSYGITSNTDGNGLYFNHVGNITTDELEAIKSKINENKTTLDNTIASIPSIDDGVTIVNHYPGTIITDLEDKTPDHQNFLLETATRHPLTNGYVYSIETAEGKAYRYTGTEAITAEEYESGDNAFHWQAVVADDGTVSFVHHDTGEQVQRATSTITLPDVTGTPDLSTVGKVGFNGQLYTITQRGTSEADATTGIREISAGSNTPSALYDLSGRRVIAPAKGIYVTSQGKKILVK